MRTILFLIKLIIISVLLGSCEKDNSEPANNPDPTPILDKFDVSYINNTLSSSFEFWAEYDFDRKILLDAGEIFTDLQVDSGEYKLEYKYYTDAGLVSHRTGYFYLIQNDTIDFFDDLYNVEDGGLH